MTSERTIPSGGRLLVAVCVSLSLLCAALTVAYLGLAGLLPVDGPDEAIAWRFLLISPPTLLVLLAYSAWRLRSVVAVLGCMRRGDVPALDERRRAARDAMVLPPAFLVGGALVAAGASLLLWILGGSVFPGSLQAAGRQVISLMSVLLAFGMIAFLVLRNLMRPALSVFRVPDIPLEMRYSVRLRLTLWSLLLVVIVASVILVGDRQGLGALGAQAGIPGWGLASDPGSAVGSGLSASDLLIVTAFALVIGWLLGQEIRGHALATKKHLDSIHATAQSSIARLPVHSANEMGRIALAFNRLAGRLEREHVRIEEYIDQVRRSEVMRSRFLASVSHELRTPLNSILGFSDILLQGFEGEINERQREALRVINQDGERLLELINDILLMARMEAGHALLVPTEFTFKGFVEAAKAAAGASSDDRIREDVDAEIADGLMTGDEPKLTRALAAMIEQAVGETGGSVRLRVEVTTPSNLRVVVECPQMPPPDGDEYEHLFDGFRRSVHRSGMDRQVGLGLPLARKIARLHGGDVAFAVDDGDVILQMTLPNAWMNEGDDGVHESI